MYVTANKGEMLATDAGADMGYVSVSMAAGVWR